LTAVVKLRSVFRFEPIIVIDQCFEVAVLVSCTQVKLL